MKWFIDGYATENFNERAQVIKNESLTQDMLQAFYRQEYETIDVLRKKGAQFTLEMLDVAINLKDPQLALKCVDAGLVTDKVKSFAQQQNNAQLNKAVHAKLS